MAKEHRITFPQSFLAGGLAGVLSRSITSPINVVKVYSQVGAPETKQGLLKSFQIIYKSEGIRAFWKGNGIACIRLFPYGAIQFATFVQLRVSCCYYEENTF